MHKSLILFFILFIGLGCHNNRLDRIEIPGNIALDVDQDGTSDFTVTYSKRTEGDPAGNYEAVTAYLESSHMNEVLKNQDDLPLFLNDIDLIQPEVSLPLYWEVTNPSSNFSTPIARLRTDYDGITWNDEWKIFSHEEKRTYMMGFKLLSDNTVQLGHIEFSINAQTGQFILIESVLL